MTCLSDDIGKFGKLSISEWRQRFGGGAESPLRGLQLGLDIDDTITAAPALFAEISRECRLNDGQVHIVTSRSALGRSETVEELSDYGVQFDALFFLPEMSRANSDCPHKELDWFQRYLWQKVAYAKQHGLMHFVDDDPKVISLFNQFAPEIVITSASDRVRLPDPLYEHAVMLVIKSREASASLIQRHLKLGYNRALRLMDAMCEHSIVTPMNEDGARQIVPKFRTSPLVRIDPIKEE